ncbi:MAG: HAD-IA family hydrolase [candidate division WOR-3 bacterium]
MVRAVVFDLDNTLVDFDKWKNAAVDAAIMAMIDAGLDLTPEAARKKIYAIYEEKGIEYQEVFNDFLQDVLGLIDYRILASGIIAYRRAREGSLVPYPHVHLALLKLFRMGLKLAVVSDAPRLQVWMRLVSLGVDRFFDVVVTFDDTGKRKPAREPFEKVLELLQVKPGETMMVGDWAERDIVGAKELGMITVFARYGDAFGTKNSGADYEINDVLELVPLIEILNRSSEGQ